MGRKSWSREGGRECGRTERGGEGGRRMGKWGDYRVRRRKASHSWFDSSPLVFLGTESPFSYLLLPSLPPRTRVPSTTPTIPHEDLSPESENCLPHFYKMSVLFGQKRKEEKKWNNLCFGNSASWPYSE